MEPEMLFFKFKFLPLVKFDVFILRNKKQGLQYKSRYEMVETDIQDDSTILVNMGGVTTRCYS